MRLLISAFAISPTEGSERGVGWAFVSRLAAEHDVTILYGDVNGDSSQRTELEAWMREHPEAPRMQLAYVPGSGWARLWERIHRLPGLHFLYYAAYSHWQKQAFKVASRLHRASAFDAVHQLTFCSYREPGYLWELGIPFFWGPVSGRANFPPRYFSILDTRSRFEALVRNILNTSTAIINLRVRSAARKAAHIWCVSPAEAEFFNHFGAPTSLMATGSAPESASQLRKLLPGTPLRVVWSGLHIGRKALPLLVMAAAQLRANADIEFHILGEGRPGASETITAKALASRLGVEHLFTWHGSLPRESALTLMDSCHVFVHTAVLEGTPWVVLEALASGMPVVCHDVCGMARAVTEDSGIKIQLSTPQGSAEAFAHALDRLCTESGLLEALSSGAALRALQLNWASMIERVLRSYEIEVR